DRDVARVGVGQGDLDDLAGDEGAVEVAGLGVAQDGFGRVEDAVLGGREAPPGTAGFGGILAGRLHAILGLPRFSKGALIASRRRSWTLEPSSRAICRSWREAGGSKKPAMVFLPRRLGTRCAWAFGAATAWGLGGSARPLAWRRPSLRLDRDFDMTTILPVYTSTCKAVGSRGRPSLPAPARGRSAPRSGRG